MGVNSDSVDCKPGFRLIIQQTNESGETSPACVKPETKQKLIERGWAGEKSWTATYDDSNVPTVIIPLGSGSVSTQKNFEPQTIKVVLGVNNTVRWINQDDVPSSVTSDHEYDGHGFVSPRLKPGDTWTHTFTKAGVYDYHGIPHPWKNGKVIVEKKSLTVDEEELVAELLIFDLKDSQALNIYEFQIGKFSYDVDGDSIIEFCGKFNKKIKNQYFEGL